MHDMLSRFLIGGLVVTCFSILGDVIRPKSFAGLFGAAPTIALATVGLTVAKSGKTFVTIEARSMIAGALAFFVYAWAASWMLLHREARSTIITVALLPSWFVIAFGLWYWCLR